MRTSLLDLQVNGFAGVDFQAEELSRDELLRAVCRLQRAGCTRFLLTLVTDEWDKLLAKIQRLRRLRGGPETAGDPRRRQDPAEQGGTRRPWRAGNGGLGTARPTDDRFPGSTPSLHTAIAGWHLEGPFLSSEPAYHGAHDPALMLDPTPERIRALRDATAGDVVLLTLAPERRRAIEAIALATSLGMKVSLGHTNASAACLREAVAAGATGFTHLGNACPQQLDRHDNILWRVLDTPGLYVTLIADKLHVSPPLFRIFHRLIPGERIIYITDAMAAAGMPPGHYRIGRLELEVGADRLVRYPGRTNFAGSSATPVEAVFNAAEMLGVPWQETWRRMSVAPAQWLGLPVNDAPEPAEDFFPVKVSPEGRLEQLLPGRRDRLPHAS